MNTRSGQAGRGNSTVENRVGPQRMHKMLIGGAYTRSESGHTYASSAGRVPQASRKDARSAVTAARSGQESWARFSPYQKGQVLYRLAELLSERSEQICRELAVTSNADDPKTEFTAGLEKLIWHAGWPDKLSQVLGSANMVSQPYVSISNPVPVGVIVATPRADLPFADALDALGGALAGGSSVIVLAPETNPIVAVSIAEAAGTADFPAGALNVLTGQHEEALLTLAGHGDVNALDLSGAVNATLAKAALEKATATLKRCIHPGHYHGGDLSLRRLRLSCEVRTVWHPQGY